MPVQLPVITASAEELLDASARGQLEKILPDYVVSCRWFGGKARSIESMSLDGAIELPGGTYRDYIAMLTVRYEDGGAQTYVLPLGVAGGAEAESILEKAPGAAIATLHGDGDDDFLLYDALWDRGFALRILEAISQEQSFESSGGKLAARHTGAFGDVFGGDMESFEPSVMGVEQSNTSVVYGGRGILKFFRRLEEGTSPDLEIGRFLGEIGFQHSPPLTGSIEYLRGEGEEARTLAILQGFVANRGDAWKYTLQALDEYFEKGGSTVFSYTRGVHLLDMVSEEPPEAFQRAVGGYLESARLLGRRTAQMHVALASGINNPDFAPEPFTEGYQRELFNQMHGLTAQAMELLARRVEALPLQERGEAEETLGLRSEILGRFEPLIARKLSAMRTRVHGDYHLGQVLYTGSDFVIIDFEGEPVRSLPERRQKQSPLKDVAGMLRSFHYAAYTGLLARQGENSGDMVRQQADAWHLYVSAAFLDEYLKAASESVFLPSDAEELRVMLDIYLLEKAVYELVYELNNRPKWVRIPLGGIRQLVS